MRLVFVLSLFVARPASAAELVLSGRIERVVVAGGLVAAIRGDEVRVLAEDGRTLLRLGVGPDEDAPEGRARDHEVEEVLERNEIADEDRDSDYAEALIEDEASLRQRHAARGQGLSEVGARPVVAGSEHGLWIASRHTLWRVDSSERAHPVATLAQRFDHLAAGPGGRLIAATGAGLMESRDGGVTFQRLAEATGPVRALAATETRVAWLAGGELTWLEDGRATTLPFEQARELRACGPSLLALGPRDLLVVAPERTTTIAAEAWRLGCAGTTWVLVGQRLLVSTDEGRTFAARFDLPPAVALDAGVGQRFLWVGTAAGLFRLTDDQSAPAPALAAVTGRRDRAAWAPLLPRLTIATSALLAPGRRDLRAVAYADFPLGAAGAPVPPAPRLVQLEPAAPPAVWTAPLAPDREASCLPLVRAQAVARALVEPERARSYVARAAHAAWLPELRALYARRLGRSESLDLPADGVDAGPLGLDTANDVRWEARAIWDLSKLVFSSEEMAAITTALRMADMRREVESLANRLYFERRRLKLEPVASPAAEPRGRRELRIQELEAELDALSGGAFTRCLPAPP